MVNYTFGGKGGKKNTLEESNDRVVVRTRNARTLDDAVASDEGKEVLKDFNVELEFREADVTVLQTKELESADTTIRDNARSVLKNEPELRFAGRVLVDPESREPVVYSENIFIKFYDHVPAEVCEKILAENELVIKQRPDYAVNVYFVSAAENIGLEVFEKAGSLLELKEVELCHPELIREKGSRVIHPQQWHLKAATINGVEVNAHVNADPAHLITQGENTVIAIIDDGFDIDHPEFNIPGKVVHSVDVVTGSSNPRPMGSNDHGTSCAGVATASGIMVSGVAPESALMPVRCKANLGSIAESNAFKWAADHGADIISCSWGPVDGDWYNPGDPTHTSFVGLPDHTRLAIDYAIEKGRNGKGCVVLFAAGNGNENVMYDGYANYHKVIAVAACNDTNRRSVYSDYGRNVWCCFPSNDFGYKPFNHPAPLTRGIYTTDRLNSAGYSPGNYTDDFGGTSSACPGVAGTVALMLSANPDLTWLQVREILKETSEKIDLDSGQYDAEGHSIFYGFGKVDAEKAVKKAVEMKTIPMPPEVKIISALVNPAGTDKGQEKISILNTSAGDVDLTNWFFKVNDHKQVYTGILSAGEAKTITLADSALRLPNSGATIHLCNARSDIIHSVTYQKKQVKKGVTLIFTDLAGPSPVSRSIGRSFYPKGDEERSFPGPDISDETSTNVTFDQRQDEADNNL